MVVRAKLGPETALFMRMEKELGRAQNLLGNLSEDYLTPKMITLQRMNLCSSAKS